jgi:hypothetical protein
MNSDQLRDDLKHLRFVHFSLMLVAATVIYLSYVAASNIDGTLYSEVGALSNLLQDLQSGRAAAPEDLGWYPKQLEDNLHARGYNIESIDVETSSRCALRSSISDSQTIPQVAEAISRVSCLQYQPLRLYFPSGRVANRLRETIHSQKIGHDALLEGRLVFGEPDKKQFATGWLTLRFAVTDPYQSNGGGFQQVGDRIPVLVLVSKSTTVPFDDWFAKNCPVLKARLGDFKKESMRRAYSDIERLQHDDIKKLKASFFGIDVEPEHVGVTGVLAIIALLLYVWLYLGNVSDLVKLCSSDEGTPVPWFSPWLCVADAPLGPCVTVATALIIPTAGVFMSLRMLVTQTNPVLLLGTVVAAMFIGFAITFRASDLAAMRIADISAEEIFDPTSSLVRAARER